MLTSELFFIYLSNYLMFMMAYNFLKTLRGYACPQPLKATYAFHCESFQRCYGHITSSM